MDAEAQRLINLLRTAMRILGITNREVERRLGMSASYLTRVFAGGVELKVDHLIRISRAIGLEPAEFFHLAYPKRTGSGSKAAGQLRDTLRSLQPPPEAQPPEPPPDELMEKLLLTSLRTLMDQEVAERAKK